MTPDYVNRSDREVEDSKFIFANAVQYQLDKFNIPVAKLAAAARVDRAQLHYWLQKKVRLREDAVERLMLATGLTISYRPGWKPPEALEKDLPGPAPARKKRSRPNNKPR